MTAAAVAALTVYDMVKGVERGVEVRSLRLLSKTGGSSGEWHRPEDGQEAAARERAVRARPVPGGKRAAPPKRPKQR